MPNGRRQLFPAVPLIYLSLPHRKTHFLSLFDESCSQVVGSVVLTNCSLSNELIVAYCTTEFVSVSNLFTSVIEINKAMVLTNVLKKNNFRT